jgi:large subunit ribosomal protein L20
MLKLAKGFRLRRSSHYRYASDAVDHGMQYAYRDRKAKKRNFRALWIQRINAAARQHDMTYSVFINGLLKAGVQVDRKVLSDIATREPAAFAAVVEKAKAALAA